MRRSVRYEKYNVADITNVEHSGPILSSAKVAEESLEQNKDSWLRHLNENYTYSPSATDKQ